MISEKAKIAKTAVIQDGVTIEDDVIIHDFAVIYSGTVLKKGCEIYENCVVGRYPTSPGSTARALKTQYGTTVIGEKTILCPGVVIYAGTHIGLSLIHI